MTKYNLRAFFLLIAAGFVISGMRTVLAEEAPAVKAGNETPTALNIIPKPFSAEIKGEWSPAGELSIIIPDKADKGENFAAEELKRCLKVNIPDNIPVYPVSKAPKTKGKTLIFLGRACGAELNINETWAGKEGYGLEIKDKGIFVRGGTKTGLLYGVYTLSQCLEKKDGKNGFRKLYIKDRPRFELRGLLDVYVDWGADNKKMVDMLSFTKQNVLHVIVDIDLPESGDKKKAEEFIAYAAERGVDILPQVQMSPKHSDWTRAPKETHCKTKEGKMIEEKKLCPGNEKTYEYLEKKFKKAAKFFPSKYLHFGADEAENFGHPEECAYCKKLYEKLKNNPAYGSPNKSLLYYYYERIAGIIVKAGKTPVCWEDDLNRTLPEGTVINQWRSFAYRTDDNPAWKNRKFILSNPNVPKYNLYWDLSGSTSGVYNFEIFPAGTPPEKEGNCLGLIACRWCNRPQRTYFNNVWPQQLAVSETGWYGEKQKDLNGFSARITAVQKFMETRWEVKFAAIE